jgi:uncharacterized C2H2 Zn-finger protein
MIQYLDKVKSAGSSGKGKSYRAACPVHDGRDRNLLVTERPDGSWFCKCFVCGAVTRDVKDALRLSWSDINPEYKCDNQSRPVYKGGKDQRMKDKYLIQICELNGFSTHTDKIAYQKAKARLQVFNDKMKEWMDNVK